MSLRLEGQVHDDQVHRIFKTLFDRELLENLGLWPFLTLIQDINAPYYFSLNKEETAVDIVVTPPEGKVWEILYGRYVFTADAGVADRAVRLTVGDVDGYTYLPIYSETIAAEAVATWNTGAPTPSANAWPDDDVDIRIILSDTMALNFTATNKEDGDTLSMRVFIKETVNYAP